MSGIFGLVNLDGAPVDPAHVEAMRGAMAHWGPDGSSTLVEGAAGFGQCLLYNTPEALHERLPRRVGPGWLFTAEARIDNRDELCDFFHIPSAERLTTPDSELMWLAYEKWGEESPNHLLGDWSFAVWRPEERRLFLARDHHGKTALYFAQNAGRLAFASDRRALLALAWVSRTLDELHFAQVMVQWPAFHRDATHFRDVKRLLPAHTLRARSGGVHTSRYWRLEDVPDVHLSSDAEYVDAFLDVFDRAVSCRLRSYRPVASFLSGGLDSGSVAATAARQLAAQGRRLTAFTSVPLCVDESPAGPAKFANEWPLAAATAAMAGTIDHVMVSAANLSPLEGVRRMQATHGEVLRGASNYYWIAAIYDEARRLGIGTLLDGQIGNGTISWAGAPGRHNPLTRALPARVTQQLMYWRNHHAVRHLDEPWRVLSAIRTGFARELSLAALMAAAGFTPSLGPTLEGEHAARMWVIRPGASILGSLSAELAAMAAVETRDPTADVRVMAFALGVPSAQWTGPPRRGLLRRAMVGRLPDVVRLNMRRGLQSADVMSRLCQESAAIDAATRRCEVSSRVRHYLDVPRLRASATWLDLPATPWLTNRVRSVLLTGLAGAHFLDNVLDT